MPYLAAQQARGRPYGICPTTLPDLGSEPPRDCRRPNILWKGVRMSDQTQQRPGKPPDSPPQPPEYPFRHPDERPDQSPIEQPPLEPDRYPDRPPDEEPWIDPEPQPRDIGDLASHPKLS